MVETFLEIPVAEVETIEELPQESVSLKRADSMLRVIDKEGNTFLVLWEFLSQWKRKTPLHVLDYTVRAMIKFDLSVIPVILLLKPSSLATDLFEKSGITFKFTVLRLYKMSAIEFMQHADIHLLPFVGGMKGYAQAVWKADKKIYESDLAATDKANLLTAMTILTGLQDEELARKLVERRRDIMIQSYAYDIIKEEGQLEGARKAIYDVLETRFDVVPQDVTDEIEKIAPMPRLETILRKAVTVKDMQEFRELLKKFLEVV